MAKSNKSDDGKVKQSRSNQTTTFRGGSKKKSKPQTTILAMSAKPQTTIIREDGYVSKAEQARGGPYHNSKSEKMAMTAKQIKQEEDQTTTQANEGNVKQIR